MDEHQELLTIGQLARGLAGVGDAVDDGTAKWREAAARPILRSPSKPGEPVPLSTMGRGYDDDPAAFLAAAAAGRRGAALLSLQRR